MKRLLPIGIQDFADVCGGEGCHLDEAAFVTLKTSRLIDQACLKSEKALSLLRFVKSFEAKAGVAHG